MSEPGFKTALSVLSDRIDSDKIKLNRDNCEVVSLGPGVNGILRKGVEALAALSQAAARA